MLALRQSATTDYIFHQQGVTKYISHMLFCIRPKGAGQGQGQGVMFVYYVIFELVMWLVWLFACARIRNNWCRYLIAKFCKLCTGWIANNYIHTGDL